MLIKFTQVKLLSFKRDAKKGQVSMVAGLTKKVSEQMAWGDLPETYEGGTPDGELMASQMVLCNSAGDIAKYEYTINCTKVHGFELVRHEIEGKRGKGFRFSVHFKVDFQDPGGCGMLEQYFNTARDSRGTLQVTYNLPSTQVDMSEVDGDAERQLGLPGAEVENDEDED